MNLVALAKLSWRLITEKERLWANVVASKCMHNRPKIENLKTKRGASSIWNGIVHDAFILEKGARKTVRNGCNTNFWLDTWSGYSALREETQAPIPEHMLQTKVVDYWDTNRGWNWSTLKPLLNSKACNILASKRLSEDYNKEDAITWGYEESDLFTIKSAYSLAKGNVHITRDSDWQNIWKIKVPNRICTFLWLVKHGKILTNVERYKRRLTSNENCEDCNEEREGIKHLF